jgi:hypothetical protein
MSGRASEIDLKSESSESLSLLKVMSDAGQYEARDH